MHQLELSANRRDSVTCSSVSTSSQPTISAEDKPSLCTLSVCTSCRTAGISRHPKESRPGYSFYEELRDTIDKSPLRDRVDVRAVECLSICPRPCGIALSATGRWSYLFGDLRPTVTVAEVLECISLYLNSPKGLMPRQLRPEALRGGILGRIPPPVETEQCI